MKTLFTFTALLSMAILMSAISHAQTNIALNAPVRVSTPSTEPYTKDKNPAQLTDGKFAGNDFDEEHKTSSLWVQKGALTWRVVKDPLITIIDLGAVKPISGVSFSTAGGRAGVQFPSFIGIAVSEDNRTWHYHGNLLGLSRKNGAPPVEGYASFHYKTLDLKTKGRYVALSVIQTPYTVVDEIEVYGGENEWLSLPIGGEKLNSLIDIENSVKGATTALLVQRRVDADVKSIKAALAQSTLAASRKNAFLGRLDQVLAENDQLRLPDGNVRTTLPINDTHRKVMAVYGEFLATQNVQPLTIWKQHRYAWLSHLQKPARQGRVSLEFSLFKNQFRSDAFLLTNAGGREKRVTIQLENPPTGAEKGWLEVQSVAWTDTYQGIPVADAFLPVEPVAGGYSLTIPAGFTRKIWLIVDSSRLKPGTYDSALRIEGKTVPFRLTVSSITMQRPRLSLNVWDYTDGKSLTNGASRGINSKNVQSAVAVMKSHYVDSPEATRLVLPWPGEEDYDQNHQLKAPLTFTEFDKWVALWPEARNYFVFVSARRNEKFAGAEPGTAAFNARLASWAQALGRHMKSLNLRPEQLVLAIFDEPGLRGEKTNDEWENQLIADWSRPIKGSGAGISLIANPVWKRPDLMKLQESMSNMDALMPLAENYYRGTQEARDYYQKHRANGTDLWLYSCMGPIRLFDPQQYYRAQAWRVFSVGGKGMGFWALNDIGAGETAWHDYAIPASYAPAFVDIDTVYNSVHWESVREGMQDFEELAMLQDAINKTVDLKHKRQAEEVLKQALDAIHSAYVFAGKAPTWEQIHWSNNLPAEIYDVHLQRVRKMIETLEVN